MNIWCFRNILKSTKMNASTGHIHVDLSAFRPPLGREKLEFQAFQLQQS